MAENNGQSLIKAFMSDPILKILLKNSNLTETQFETFLISIFANIFMQNGFSYDEIVHFRSTKVSKGAFNNSLRQARRNIIKALYTILLLSYIGIMDEGPFSEYTLLAGKLREYRDRCKALVESGDDERARKVIKLVERELRKTLEEMANPKTLRGARIRPI